ncbi:MAG: ATP-binding protein [Campylobacteraceae bacterium]|nr:ATP-binding protein [Campylobacteraceae bacterium]
MKVGKIISINFNQFKVKIFSEISGGSVNLNGDVYYFGNIGSYLKTINAVGEVIICEVVSIFDSDLYNEHKAFNVDGHRELMLKPIGTINTESKFSLGVGIYPSLYSDVNIVRNDDMKIILNTVASSKPTKIHKTFSLGTSKNLINYPIDIGIDAFFNIHSAILGNSGSGKSNTIAHIMQSIYHKKDNSAVGSRFIIFDVNGEYKTAFPKDLNKNLTIKYYKPNIKKSEENDFDTFYMPHFLLSLDEWSAFLLATDATQRPFWSKVLQESYRFYKISTSQGEESKKFINYLRYKLCSLLNSVLSQADTDTSRITTAGAVISNIQNIINSDSKLLEKCKEEGLLNDISILQSNCTINFGSNNGLLINELKKITKKVNFQEVQVVTNERIKEGEFFDYRFLKISAEMTLLEEDARGNKQIRGYTATMLTRLDYFLENSDCNFMRNQPAGVINLKTYLDNLWGLDKNIFNTQLIIIDTSELGIDILETLTSVVSRLIFSERKELENDNRRKKPIHLILDEAHRYIKKDSKYLLKENIFERIAREGRKYSLYLIISSQRPSELSETVLSQCSNFIIHRIQNEVDMRYINAVLPYFSEDFTNKIKQSLPGEALVFGNCVSMPLHITVHPANPEPNSKNCKIAKEWFLNSDDEL